MNYNAPRHGSQQLRTSLMTPLPGFYRGRIRTVLLILLAASFLSVVVWKGQRVQAALFTSTQSGPWEDSNTWGGAGVPGPSDNIIISSPTTVTMSADHFCRELTVDGTLDLAGHKLDLNFNLSNNNAVISSMGIGVIVF